MCEEMKIRESGDFRYNLIEGWSFVPFQALQYSSYLVRISDNRDHFHLTATFLTDQGINFIYFLYEPHPTLP